MVELFLKPFTEGALHAGGHRLVEVAMELLYVLSVKDEVALSLLDMATTYPVLHVISLEDAKFAKVQESVYAPILISLDTYQVRIPFMVRMGELSPQIVSEAEEVLPLVLLRLHAHVRHHPHVALVADVVEQELTRHRDLGEVCHHGWHIITAKEINALIVVTILAICTINVHHVTYQGIKRVISLKTASELVRRSFFHYVVTSSHYPS